MAVKYLFLMVLTTFALLISSAPIWSNQQDVLKSIRVPAGPFISGSDRTERDYAYKLDEAAYGSAVTREQQWYEGERPRGYVDTGPYRIMVTPITNAQYAVFVQATGHHAPDVDRETWQSYGLRYNFDETRRFAWRNGKPPRGHEHHPVVLVNMADAKAYAGWLGKVTGHVWRLPTEAEWEKAARGPDGHYFPWGNTFDPNRLNSADRGPFGTTPVGRFVNGASSYGMLDAAGQVFEWTASTDANSNAVVKGGSWDDKGCGVCRPAARHGRPPDLKHILIGFRLVRD